MKKLSTVLAAGAIVSASLLIPATAAAQEPSNASYFCDDSEFSLGCYTDGTPRVPGLDFLEAQAYAASDDENKVPADFQRPPSALAGLFTGSAG